MIMSIQLCNELLQAIRPILGEIADRVAPMPTRGDRFFFMLNRRLRNEKQQMIFVDRGYLEDWNNGIDGLGNKHPSSKQIESDLANALMFADTLGPDEEKTRWTIQELIARIP